MEAIPKNEALSPELARLRSGLIRLRDQENINYAVISKATDIHRSIISSFANGKELNPKYVKPLQKFVQSIIEKAESGEPDAYTLAPSYKTTLDLYETSGYREGVGWCALCVKRRSLGAMVGNPGTGKTTILKEFARCTPGSAYIEAWPGMRMGDLLRAIAVAVGVTISGNTYTKAQQIIAALKDRRDVVLLIDEAEHLHKWDVDKFEVLRKIWDNTGTPIIICGTPVLKRLLTRENLAQFYRRMFEIKVEGIKPNEARTILTDYTVS